MRLTGFCHHPIAKRWCAPLFAGFGFSLLFAASASGQPNPDPRITGIRPISALAGGPGFTLEVYGTGFGLASVVRWNGQNRLTSLAGDVEFPFLRATILATDIAVGGTASVTVFNPPPGGGTSNAWVFRIESYPMPRINTINPNTRVAGSPGFTLTVDGADFLGLDPDRPGIVSRIRWNGTDRTTNFISSSRLTTIIPASDITTAGTAIITVFTPGGGSSNPATLTINNAIPTIAGINPVSAVARGPAFNLVVMGTGFFSGSMVQWNGMPRQTTFIPGEFPFLRALIPAEDIAEGGSATIRVFNPAPGGGTSNAVTFTIIGNPLPRITTLEPPSTAAGGPAFVLTVNGSGFVRGDPIENVPGSVVRWNNVNRPTTFVTSTQLRAAIPADDIAATGTATVTVFNPTPGGGTSNEVLFTTVNPMPTISGLNPPAATAGGSAFTLAVTGTNFVAGSVVRWNGANRATTFVSRTQLTAAIPAVDIAAPTRASVAVFNPSPGGGTSNALDFPVATAPLPTISSLNPSSAVAGEPAFTLTVTGTNFVSASVVHWNGANRTTTFVSSMQLTAAIPASDIAEAGTASVTVFNPAPNEDTSNSFVFTIINPMPTISGINPPSAIAGGPALTLTVAGTNYVRGSVVRWNGANRPTTFVSSTQLTAVISASDIVGQAIAIVTVFNPAPGGGTSNSVDFPVRGSPQPTITSLSPSSAVAGGPAFTLTVTGTNFVSGSVVRWNGANRPTTFVSSTQLTAVIPASDIASPTTAAVTVFNPAPSEGTSNAADFPVRADGVPTITGLNPASATEGGQAFSLTITGTNFVIGSVVRWNGANRPTTFVSSNQLIAAIPASDIVITTTASITVFNPSPGGGVSNPQSFSVRPLPEVTIGGLGDSLESLEQPSVTLTLSISQSSVLSGQMTLTFTPDAVNPSDDPAIQFSISSRPGGRIVEFTVPADSSRALFAGLPDVSFQTGSIAGSITLNVFLQGVNRGSRTIPIRRQPPRIISVTVGSRTATSFELVIVGLSNIRALNQGDFRFTPRGGGNLQPPQVSVNLNNDSNTWYQSEISKPFGSCFSLVVLFTVQGDISAIGSVSVTLSNAEGMSAQVTANF